MEYKKTLAIRFAKAWSLQLYSKNLRDTNRYHLRSDMKEIRNGIIKEFEINMKPYDSNTELDEENDDILYDAIANSGKTITLYDLIEWFNEQYNSIREEAKDLPQLQFPVYKWEKGKMEDTSFVFEDFCDFPFNLFFTDSKEKNDEYIRRRLYISIERDGTCRQGICAMGPCYVDAKKIDSISEDVIKEYIEISKKYENYLKAFNFLRRTNTEIDNSQFQKKGPLTTAIIGGDPYRNLTHFIVHYAHGGNEDAYYFTYNLGQPTLGVPILNFFEPFVVGEVLSEQEDIRKNNPHILAKTLRVNKEVLPFKIK